MSEPYWPSGEIKIEGKSIPGGELQVEYGCSSEVHFLRPEQVTMVDAEGNESPYPMCEVCGAAKSWIAGREAFAWICMSCEGVVPVEFKFEPTPDMNFVGRMRKWISKEEAKEFWPDEHKGSDSTHDR